MFTFHLKPTHCERHPAPWLPVLSACIVATVSAAASAVELEPPAGAGSAPAASWHVRGLPRGGKPLTRFSVETVDGKRAVRIEADRSYANLVFDLPPGSEAADLSWSWHVDEPNDAADLHRKSGDDTAVKVCALFDLPIDKVPFVDRTVIKLARSNTGEPIPAATICYVWDAHLPVGTWIDSPFTHQLRYLVLQSGPAKAGEWPVEKRDLAADFHRAFGDESPDAVPPLLGIGIGADADNTQGHSVSHVSDLTLGR